MPAELPSRAERLFALRTCSAFDELTAGELWRVGASLRPRQFAAGQTITLSGMPLAALEFIVNGSVHVHGHGGFQILGPRDVIGDLVELLDEASAPYAVAREPTLTLEFDRSALEDLLEDDFSIFLGVLRATARRLVQRNDSAPSRRPRVRGGGSRRSHRAALDLVERVLLLQRSAPFSRCEIAPLATLVEAATEFSLVPDAPLFPAGTSADSFVVLANGTAVVRSRNGPLRAGAGDVLGMAESLAGQADWPLATAETTLRGLRIAAGSLIDVIEDYPSFGLGLLRALAHEIDEGAS